MDSWLHNRSCRPFSSAAPPLGRKRSDHTKSKLQVWNSLEKVKQYMPEFLCYSVGCKWDLRKCERAHTWVIPMFHLHRLLWISIISRMSFSGVTSTKVTWTGFKNGRACLLRLTLNILTAVQKGQVFFTTLLKSVTPPPRPLGTFRTFYVSFCQKKSFC